MKQMIHILILVANEIRQTQEKFQISNHKFQKKRKKKKKNTKSETYWCFLFCFIFLVLVFSCLTASRRQGFLVLSKYYY